MTATTARRPLTDITLCPVCLTELPPGYDFDHVAIDRALDSDPDLLNAMDPAEQCEVVLTGLARGLTVTGIARRFGWSTGRVRALLPDEHPESTAGARKRRAAQRRQLDQLVHDLAAQGLPDTEIALRTERSVYVITDTRRRLNLASHRARRHQVSGGVR